MDNIKNDIIKVVISTKNKEEIKNKAKELNLSMSSFCLNAINNIDIKSVPPVANTETILELGRISNNINQLAKQANLGNVVNLQGNKTFEDFRKWAVHFQKKVRELQ